MKGIAFIGMAGVGKSAVGKRVAFALDWRFVDLDKLILESQKMSHHDYMKLYGEQALSDLENRLTLELDLQDTVYAPPGSMVYAKQSMEKIKKDSVVVYLQSTPEVIAERMGEHLYRNGIIGLEDKGLAKLMAEREVLYEKYADLTFVSGRQSKEAMAMKVINGLQQAGIELVLVNAIL